MELNKKELVMLQNLIYYEKERIDDELNKIYKIYDNIKDTTNKEIYRNTIIQPKRDRRNALSELQHKLLIEWER